MVVGPGIVNIQVALKSSLIAILEGEFEIENI